MVLSFSRLLVIQHVARSAICSGSVTLPCGRYLAFLASGFVNRFPLWVSLIGTYILADAFELCNHFLEFFQILFFVVGCFAVWLAFPD